MKYFFKHITFCFCFLLFLSITTFSQIADKRLLPILENDLWGFIDTKGNVVIKPQFKYLLDDFQDGLAIIQMDIPNFPTDKGRVDIPPTKFGFIDNTGKVVLEVLANSVRNFDKGRAVIQKGSYYDGKYHNDGKYGFIDKTGKVVIEPQFDAIYSFHEDLAAVKIGKKWGFIDRNGKVVIKPQFDDIDNFSEGFAAIKDNGKWGYIDKSGKIVIKPQFKRAVEFSNGMARIKQKQYGDYGYIDKTGKIVISPKYNNAGYFYDGKASVSVFKNDKFTHLCINKKDEVLPSNICNKPKVYPAASKFSNTRSPKFFVDEFGEVVFENKWDGVRGFVDGVALVYKNNKDKHWCGLHVPGWILIFDLCACWGYIDESGNYIWKQPELE